MNPLRAKPSCPSLPRQTYGLHTHLPSLPDPDSCPDSPLNKALAGRTS